MILSKLGYGVDVVGDGKAALEALNHHSYDLILMDFHMPEMDGLEATKAIRAHGGAWSKIPIIALTASALVGERDKCIAAGMNDYLAKPIDSEALARMLSTWTVDMPQPAPVEAA